MESEHLRRKIVRKFLCVQLYTRSAGLFRGWVGPALIAGNQEPVFLRTLKTG